MHDQRAWDAHALVAAQPGGALPYGLQELTHFGNELTVARGSHHLPLGRLRHHAARISPGNSGLAAAAASAGQLASADLVLSMFENVGLGFARLQTSRLLPQGRVPHVMITCWLAQTCRESTAGQRRSLRRSLKGVDRLVVFSENQVQDLAEHLLVAPERIVNVPFGVDTTYYDASAVGRSTSGGGGVVAVGRDSRRDYGTLAEAARRSGFALTLVCSPGNLRGLELPSDARVLTDLDHAAYRRLLLSADVVVTPTSAPAYPSGQSVVLEAMALGRACVTTRSTAMEEYVRHGVDGLLVPQSDPEALARAITDLQSSLAHRDRLGEAAATAVRDRFTLRHLWAAVASVLTDVHARAR